MNPLQELGRPNAPAATDRLAPTRNATPPAARPRPRPDAENFGGEVSFCTSLCFTSFDHLVGGASKPRTQLTPGRRHDAVLGFGLVSATSRPYGTRAYKRPDEVSTPSNSLASLRSRVSKPSLNQP